MIASYNLRNVQALLTEELTEEELYCLCYDLPDLRSVYDGLTRHSGKAALINRLLKRTPHIQIEPLLTWVKEHKPAQYRQYQPYVLNPVTASEAHLSTLSLSASLSTSPPLPASPPLNPFGDTGRLTDPSRFFDREELLRQIFEELNKGVNLSLVGESQVGKSSILSLICSLGPERTGLPSTAFAYLNLEWVDHEEDFYEALCETMGVETCRGFKLTRALRGKRYVLCLDEIEKMTWDGFTVRVRSHLRGLADGSDAPLKLIIASRSPLAHLFPDSPELDSPLAGICHQLEVGPFPPDVARAFLTSRLHSTGVEFSETEIATLVAESKGYPAHLQRAAANLYRLRIQ